MQQPGSSREMQSMADLQTNGAAHHQQFDTSTGTAAHDDFFDQMLSGITSYSWDIASPNPTAAAVTSNGQRLFSALGNKAATDLGDEQQAVAGGDQGLQYPYDESVLLASRLRQHQISGGAGVGGSGGSSKAMVLQLNQQQQQQLMIPSMARSGETGLIPLPLSLGSSGGEGSLPMDRSGDDVDAAFKASNPSGGDGLFDGFGASFQRIAQAAPNQQQHFAHPQGGGLPSQNFGAPTPGVGQGPSASAPSGGGGGTAPPRQRVRARRGQATDPHSIAERLRRERIAERMKALQELVPNANKTDKASMLDEIIDYVKFLQLQVKVLSMSRLGGAAAVAPLVADMSSEGRANGGSQAAGPGAGAPSGNNNSDNSMTVTEHQVAKLMEDDMGSAMQYLQGKGLCLMPISLASAISTATGHSRAVPPSLLAAAAANAHHHSGGVGNNNGNASSGNNVLMAHHRAHPNNNADGPPSPSVSVLTVQSAIANNNGPDGDVSRTSTTTKDAASVSKP